MTEIQHGLEGVVAFETQIAEPDKEGSALRYRGVDIEELVGKVPFEQVWGLLVDGELDGPTVGLAGAHHDHHAIGHGGHGPSFDAKRMREIASGYLRRTGGIGA